MNIRRSCVYFNYTRAYGIQRNETKQEEKEFITHASVNVN